MLKSLSRGFDVDSLFGILEAIPSCIFFKDTELRYVFSTHYWEQLNHDGTGNWDIKGKTDLEVRVDRENAIKAMEEDKRILETEKGCSYEVTFEKDGKIQYYQIIKEPVFDKEGKVYGIVGLINNITEKREMEHKLEELSSVDQLTGLWNRYAGKENIKRKISSNPEHNLFCLIDLDKFKFINDNFGHRVGDEVLIATAEVLRETAEEQGGVAMRLGGDEFVLFIPGIENPLQAEAWMIHLFERIRYVYVPAIKGREISLSVGAVLQNEYVDFDVLYKNADALMYEAKRIEGCAFYASWPA